MPTSNNNNKNTDTSPSKADAPPNNRRRLALAALAVVVLTAVIATVCVVTLRPETIPVIETEAEESLPSLLQVATTDDETGGAVLIEYTNLLEDESVLRYYVNVQDLDLTATEGVTNPDNVALYLTASSEVRAEDLPTTTMNNKNLRRRGRRKLDLMAKDEASAFRIGLVNSVDFPFRLPDTFVLGDFAGALLVEEHPDELRKTPTVVSRASFVVISNIPGSAGTVETSLVTNKPENTTMDKPETNKPESPSMDKPVTSTIDVDASSMMSDEPLPAATVPAAPLVLASDLQGSYNLDEVSITIDTVNEFRDGAVVRSARLVFDIPKLVDAPGPYLYLSKRPFSESRRGSLDDARDLHIPIESGTDGQFNVQGRFEQFLDLDVEDLDEYIGGSWIVWCRPFGIWLGGGTIEASE